MTAYDPKTISFLYDPKTMREPIGPSVHEMIEKSRERHIQNQIIADLHRRARAQGVTTLRLRRFTMKRTWAVGEYDRIVNALAERGLQMKPENVQRLATYAVSEKD